MLKRYLTTLIALVAIAIGAKATDYGFKIGETAITSDNYESVSSGQPWYYDSVNNVLHFTNGSYRYSSTTTIPTSQLSFLTIDGNVNPTLNISVDGNLRVEDNWKYCIYCLGNGQHLIYGNGSLTMSSNSIGIHIPDNASTNLTIKDVSLYISAFREIGIFSGSSSSITLDHCEMMISTATGVAWDARGTVKLKRCYPTNCYVNNTGAYTIVDDRSKYVSDATIKRALYDFNLTVNEPVAGGTVSNSCQVNGTGYVVADCQWGKIIGENSWIDLQEGANFVVGFVYEVVIRLNPIEGRIASPEDCIATINGKPAEIVRGSNDYITIRYTFPQLANTYFDVWVGGKQVNDINKSDVLGDGGSVSFIKNIFGKYVLILENANITNTGNPDYEFTGYGRGIYSNMSGLTIRVKGNNTIDSKGEGIYFTDNLSISGNSDNQGKLSVKGSYGIRPAKSSTAITLDISRVELTAEGTSGAGIGASNSFLGSNYNCTMTVGDANTVVKAKGTSVSLGNLNSLVFEDGLKILQPTGAYFDGEDVRDASGNIISNQWVVIGKESSITTGLEAVPQIDNGQLTNDNSMPLYNLQGQRVTHPVKGGIYIQNGKKRIIK